MIALGLLLLLAVVPAPAHAHLFHDVYEAPDNQLTRDYLTLVKLIDYPYEKFDVAARTYRGEERVRVKPGGFRGWLRRPVEPGLVFKADYQLARWSGTLAGECRRLDSAHGTRLGQRIETALAARQAEPAKTAFREAFVFLMAELFDALERHIDEPEATSTLYRFLERYHGVAHEAWLNVHDRTRAVIVRSALDAVGRTFGDRARGVPPSPEAFAQQRTRVLRTLRQAFGIA